MASLVEIGVATTTLITRLSAFAFLRWIPGHHFPPVILTATVLYLSLVVTKSRSFGDGRPSLRVAFPKLFRSEKQDQDRVAEKEEEVEHHEPWMYHDEKAIFKILFLGIPDWHEWEFSYLTIGINVLVTLLSLDLVFRGPLLYDGVNLKFSRVGYVSHNTAKVLLRDPDPANLPIYVHIKQLHSPDWTKSDTVYHMGDDTDFTHPVTLTDLKPDTSYIYTMSNNLGGSFRTAPAPGSAAAKSLTFLTSSCIKANFPYNPFAHSLSFAGFRGLSRVLRALESSPSFMLFLGDFIYVDVPLRLSSTIGHYRAEYRRVYASPSWMLPGLSLPWLHTLDDHEIANDWAGGHEVEPFPAASDPFMHYHVSVNPPLPPGTISGRETNTTYFEFVQGPAAFFMLDTRRYRTQPEPVSMFRNSTEKAHSGSEDRAQQNTHESSMLGAVQLNALLTFLTRPDPAGVRWKFVASSVPFTKNWRFGTSDTWGGFLSERARILRAMHFAEENLGVRIVILSGDRHEFAAIRYSGNSEASATLKFPRALDAGPHEFSVGPLSMFYLPFRSFKQIDEEDVALAYFPDGNNKLGSVEILPAMQGASSTMKYTLWVDGTVRWEYNLTSPSTSRTNRNNLDTWIRHRPQ